MGMALSQTFGLFRASPFSNRALCLTITVQLAITSWIVLAAPGFLVEFLALADMRSHYNFMLAIYFLSLLNGIALILFERFAIPHTSADPEALDPDVLPDSLVRSGKRVERPAKEQFHFLAHRRRNLRYAAVSRASGTMLFAKLRAACSTAASTQQLSMQLQPIGSVG